MAEPSADLNESWNRAQSALGPGWRLDALRCASTALAADERSEDWVAVAVGRDGEERTFRASDPAAALDGIVRAVRST